MCWQMPEPPHSLHELSCASPARRALSVLAHAPSTDRARREEQYAYWGVLFASRARADESPGLPPVRAQRGASAQSAPPAEMSFDLGSAPCVMPDVSDPGPHSRGERNGASGRREGDRLKRSCSQTKWLLHCLQSRRVLPCSQRLAPGGACRARSARSRRQLHTYDRQGSGCSCILGPCAHSPARGGAVLCLPATLWPRRARTHLAACSHRLARRTPQDARHARTRRSSRPRFGRVWTPVPLTPHRTHVRPLRPFNA